jgi:hypothetical protein
MAKGPKIDNEKLLTAGLSLMRQNGKELKKQTDSPGRAMLYTLPNGQSVRARTCNDHILVTLAESTAPDARLNIEGTDFLLIVMPEVERTPGKVIAYLVPSSVAANAARTEHSKWLASKPDTNGRNTTFNLWFDGEPSWISEGFASRWSQYRLKGEASTESSEATSPLQSGDLRTEVEDARRRIAAAAGVSATAVKISVDFGE